MNNFNNDIQLQIYRYIHRTHIRNVNTEYMVKFTTLVYPDRIFAALEYKYENQLTCLYNFRCMDVVNSEPKKNTGVYDRYSKVCSIPRRYFYTSGFIYLVYSKTDFLKNTGEHYITPHSHTHSHSHNINVLK